jgi:hypothetical protein
MARLASTSLPLTEKNPFESKAGRKRWVSMPALLTVVFSGILVPETMAACAAADFGVVTNAAAVKAARIQLPRWVKCATMRVANLFNILAQPVPA